MSTRKKTSVKYEKLTENKVSDHESDGSDGEDDNVPEKTSGYDGDDESAVLEQANRQQFGHIYFNSADFSSDSSDESADEIDVEGSSDDSIGDGMDDDQFKAQWDHVEAEETKAVMDEEEMEESDA
ncbi:hypothetical protein CAEBREN_02604 [Caenorhabditis brenneri]|uniref:Uncharacterized protein n=1 Tax=Caenorhabditis brenneri TaxID=135651 RepID=G0NFA2_CAEBE|nr:hypothetical protein CAEBREN_02604 [Caenorhabditis brenneri]